MSKNRRGHKHHSEENEQVRQHVILPEVEVSEIVEPRPLCSIYGEPIEAIIEAISESDSSYSHFDCVLKSLSEKYNVKEPDKVSYIGSGCFAVISTDEEGKYYIKEKINYESNEAFTSMKKFVEASKK